MKKRNIIITLVIILSLACMLPSLAMRIRFENAHNGYVAALVLRDDMTDDNLSLYKSKGIHTLLADEAELGFDAQRIAKCREMGFDIALRARVGDEKSQSYAANLDAIIKQNDVKYLVIKQNKKERAFAAPLEDVIAANDLTVVLTENMSQLSNEMPKGYESYVTSSGGKVMRCYETLKNPLRTLSADSGSQNAGELLYHHMINSARDRNTEFVAINQIDDGSGDITAAIEATSYAAAKFEAWMQNLGYESGKPVSLKGYEPQRRTASAGGAALAVMMALVCVLITLKKRSAALEYAAIIASLGAFGISFVMPDVIIMLYPTLFAPVAACFAFSVSIGACHKANENHGLFLTALCTFGAAAAALALGAFGLGSLLSGADYYLNDAIFRGVKLTLVLPVAYAICSMWIYEDCRFDLRSAIGKIKLWHVLVALAAIAVAAVYVMRSGNAKISPLENQIRNFIAELSGARPRTKEFLIGWPMLAVAAVCIKCTSPKLLRTLVCVGSSVVFASVTNTFCHVFTDFATSSLRTFNGIVFALPIVIAVFALGTVIVKKQNSEI